MGQKCVRSGSPWECCFGDGPRSVSRVWVIGHLVSLTGLAVTAVACDHLICVCPCHRTSNRPGAHLSCRKRPLPGLWLSSEARWYVPFWWFGWREPDSGLLSYADDGAPPGWELVVGARSPFRVGAWCFGKTLVVLPVACLLIPVESCSCCRGCCSCFSPPRSSSVRDAIVRPYDD